MVTKGAMWAFVEQKSLALLCNYGPWSFNMSDHCCNSAMTVMGVTNHFVIGF